MDHQQRLESLRKLKRLLDEVFRVPGTNIRFGWDPVIGLLPWVGDVVTALFSCAIIFQAHRMRLPRVVQLRMLINVAVDVLAGIVPVIGDAVVTDGASINATAFDSKPRCGSFGVPKSKS